MVASDFNGKPPPANKKKNKKKKKKKPEGPSFADNIRGSLKSAPAWRIMTCTPSTRRLFARRSG
jgi:hypothetical protein